MRASLLFPLPRMLRTVAALGLLLGTGSLAQAQGLLWSVPEEDGTGIRYEGTYTQLVKRPNAVEGDTTIVSTRRLRIASVGKEEAEFRGEKQPCRWIEFKVQTGRPKEGDIDSGPGSVRIYKILVAESIIKGKTTEPLSSDREVFISIIPIVKGFRKIGDEPAQPISPNILQISPAISLLQHYRNLKGDGETAQFELVGAGGMTSSVAGDKFTGSNILESQTSRSTNTAEIFRSEIVPFGVVKWTAKTTVEEKTSTAPRSEFVLKSEITEEMVALEVLNGVESELVTD
jgi:hypothetical protein